jgi:DNA processing protein
MAFDGAAATRQHHWLAALRAPRLGAAKLLQLLDVFGAMDALMAAGPAALARLGLEAGTIRALRHPNVRLLDADLAWLDQAGHDLLTWDSDRYPVLLREIPAPPAALFVDGDASVLWQPQLAVVGSRNPTAGGIRNAREFSVALVLQGLAVTSGLASGIDGSAHAAAIDVGGKTVAVTGTGLDRVYPASNSALAAHIRSQGVLVSEFPPGTQPRRSHFPARNRIIAGLSLATLVVEAGMNSGSLITARLAAEQGREVFALPGSIHNPMSRGCHRLIREGARLVESAMEILEEIAPLAGHLARAISPAAPSRQPDSLDNGGQHPNLAADPAYRKLRSCLGYDPMSMDSIIRHSGLTAKAVSAMLPILELRGEVEAHPGGRFSRTNRGQ